jgi:hypothetical protein
MTDILLEFMTRLRNAWPDVQVMARHHMKGESNQIGVAVQRWIQRPEGCEVTLNVAYYPSNDEPMKAMLTWLHEFHEMIQSAKVEHSFTQWWGQTAQFSTDPLQVNCNVIIRSLHKEA